MSVLRCCRKRVDMHTCVLACGISLITLFLLYVFTLPQHREVPTSIVTVPPMPRCECVRPRGAKLIPQPDVETSDEIPEVRLHRHLNIFHASEETDEERRSINNNKCVPFNTTIGMTPICVYDPKIDIHISAALIKYGVWELDYMKLISAILSDNPDMQLLDIGSNIGVYTILAAKKGRKVIAVDANKFNLRLLSKSLDLGQLQKYVTLVWNAVTDIHEKIRLTITKGNIGGSYVESAGEVDRPVNASYDVTTALTITLEDLVGLVKGSPIFMKIDIEGSEWKAFRGGELFFQDVNVRYVLMEWGTKYTQGDKGCVIIRNMCNFGFHPYEPKWTKMNKLNIAQYQYWPYDVLWIRE